MSNIQFYEDISQTWRTWSRFGESQEQLTAGIEEERYRMMRDTSQKLGLTNTVRYAYNTDCCRGGGMADALV